MNDANRATHFCYGKWSQSRSQRSFLRRFPRAAPIFLPQLWLWAIDGTFAGKREESVAFVRVKSSSSLNFTFIRTIKNPLLKTDLLITLSQQNDSARTSCRCCRCRRRQGRRGCRRERLQHVLVRWRLGIERHGSSIVRVIFHHRSSCLHSRVQRFNHEKIARIRVRELLASARCGESD